MRNITTSCKKLVDQIPTFNVERINISTITDNKVIITAFGSQSFGTQLFFLSTPVMTRDYAERFAMRYQKVLGFEIFRD